MYFPIAWIWKLLLFSNNNKLNCLKFVIISNKDKSFWYENLWLYFIMLKLQYIVCVTAKSHNLKQSHIKMTLGFWNMVAIDASVEKYAYYLEAHLKTKNLPYICYKVSGIKFFYWKKTSHGILCWNWYYTFYSELNCDWMPFLIFVIFLSIHIKKVFLKNFQLQNLVLF